MWTTQEFVTHDTFSIIFWSSSQVTSRNATYFEVQQGFRTPGNPRYVGNPDQREASLAKCLLVQFLFAGIWLNLLPALGLHLQDWDAHSIGAKKLKMFIGEFVHDTQQVFPTPGNPRYAESLGQKEASLAERRLRGLHLKIQVRVIHIPTKLFHVVSR